MTSSHIDGVLVEWGERLFYGSNRIVRSRTPVLSGATLHARADAVRRRIHAAVVRKAPQVMVKVTGGGRGMAKIAAHMRYISKGGLLPFEDDRGVVRDGAEALRDVVDQWRCGGARIPEHSERREAFNVMLSMPAGTKPEAVRHAAREFAKAELANHRYVMVLHTHQANPHVHLAVRAEGRDGHRLNPRKPDLRRWREVFAEKLRELGIEAEASSRVVRGSRHRNERLWQRKARRAAPAREDKTPALTRSRRGAIQAWARLTLALEASDDPTDRALAQSIRGHVRTMPGLAELMREVSKQRELPGMSRTIDRSPERTRSGPEWER
jgi:hypothetical protein